MREIRYHNQQVMALAGLPSGGFVSGSYDGKIAIWLSADVPTPTQVIVGATPVFSLAVRVTRSHDLVTAVGMNGIMTVYRNGIPTETVPGGGPSYYHGNAMAWVAGNSLWWVVDTKFAYGVRVEEVKSGEAKSDAVAECEPSKRVPS